MPLPRFNKWIVLATCLVLTFIICGMINKKKGVKMRSVTKMIEMQRVSKMERKVTKMMEGNKVSKMTETPSTNSMGSLRGIEFVKNNATLCRGNPKTVVVIISHSDNYKQRRAIRATWGKSTSDIRYVFLLGLSPGQRREKIATAEVDTHGDIVQMNMVEMYYRLTMKSGAMVKWVNEFCRHVKYVIKIDDDMYLDAGQYTSALDARAGHNAYLLCYLVRNPGVNRNPKSKFYVSREDWPSSRFPNYCSGTGYGFTAKIIPDMWKTALETKLMNNEDVWLTGVVVSKMKGVKRIDDRRINLTSRARNWCESKDYITTHRLSPQNLMDIWKDKLSGKTCPPKK
ncbi:beta-1,3-galactosyltransferase 5-like isoform X2 [Tubulanus polymorphus]|uniref:beta-1,3-galactosyltransferase 5-like isoform X2 n=1 Tax=Tubulanus polymorphus TaxID=672921 RepID=UPI003DA4EF4D